MPDHDELCPQRHQYRGHKSRCVCALLAAARADERAVAQVQACDAHIVQVRWAEAIAAKLVEVICEDAAVLAWDLKALEATARERDAARIDADYWKEQWQIAVRGIAESAQGTEDHGGR